jgi:hypothetical protein
MSLHNHIGERICIELWPGMLEPCELVRLADDGSALVRFNDLIGEVWVKQRHLRVPDDTNAPAAPTCGGKCRHCGCFDGYPALGTDGLVCCWKCADAHRRNR